MCQNGYTSNYSQKKKRQRNRGTTYNRTTNRKEVEDTHNIAIGGERFELHKKIERPVMCKKCLKFGHPKKYSNKEEKYCEKCAKPLNEGEDENNHICSGEYCFYCNKEHKTEDKQKCDE